MSKRIAFCAALSVILLLGFAAQAMAETDNVIITATINSKVTVTTGADHNFGTFDPDATNPAPYVAPVNVRSNVDYTIERSVTGNMWTLSMLSINTPAGMDGTTVNTKAPGAPGHDWAQTYTLNLRPTGVWMEPGLYTADVLYTTVP